MYRAIKRRNINTKKIYQHTVHTTPSYVCTYTPKNYRHNLIYRYIHVDIYAELRRVEANTSCNYP